MNAQFQGIDIPAPSLNENGAIKVDCYDPDNEIVLPLRMIITPEGHAPIIYDGIMKKNTYLNGVPCGNFHYAMYMTGLTAQLGGGDSSIGVMIDGKEYALLNYQTPA